MADVRVQPAIKIVDPTTDANAAGVDGSGNLQVILAANSGVDVGDVDILSVIPGTGATNLGKAIDTAAGGTDTGVGALAVRDDALAGITPAEGDYTTLLVDASGALWVNISAGTVSISGTVTVDSELPAAAALADDTANPTVPGVGGFLMGYDSGNTNWNRVEVDDAGHLQVDVLSGAGSDTPTGPTASNTTSAALAAGSSVDLSTDDLAETENLSMATVTSSVPFKAILKSIENGASTTIAVMFGRAGETVVFTPPHRSYISVAATGGTDTFTWSVTNMDTSEAADVYASFFYQNN